MFQKIEKPSSSFWTVGKTRYLHRRKANLGVKNTIHNFKINSKRSYKRCFCKMVTDLYIHILHWFKKKAVTSLLLLLHAYVSYQLALQREHWNSCYWGMYIPHPLSMLWKLPSSWKDWHSVMLDLNSIKCKNCPGGGVSPATEETGAVGREIESRKGGL
jgi:hypothetical protein